MIKNVYSLVLVAVFVAALASCGKKNENVGEQKAGQIPDGKPTAPPAVVPPAVQKEKEKQVERKRVTPEWPKRTVLGDVTVYEEGIFRSWLRRVAIQKAKFEAENCLRRVGYKFSAASVHYDSHILEIYNIGCPLVNERSIPQLTLAIDHHNRLYAAPKGDGTDEKVQVGSLMEVGRHPGPNTFHLYDLCTAPLEDSWSPAEYRVGPTWTVCTYTVLVSGKLKDDSWQIQRRNNRP